VRPAICERPPLGLPHTQNRMSGRPRVPEILLMSSRVESEDGAGGSRRVGQLRKLRVSRPQASLCAGACACVRAHHSCGSGLPASRAPAPARRSLCAPAGPAAHPADSNSSACAVEMSTVEKLQDTAWKDVLDTTGLSTAAPILEEYGLSCESDMSLVDKEDLVVLCSKFKPFQSKLLRKWVQGPPTLALRNVSSACSMPLLERIRHVLP
jgi:hypothetical protein